MRISTTHVFDRPMAQMARLTARADQLQAQIGTGKRFATASEAPAAWQQVAALDRAAADQTADAANVTLAQGILAQNDSTFAAIETQLRRAGELALSAANGTLADVDRATIAAELDSILDELLTLANTRDARGQPLFGGASGDRAYARGEDGSIGFVGEGAPSPIPIGGGESIQATVSGQTVFGGIATAAGSTDMFALVADLTQALRAGGEGLGTAVSHAIDGIGAAGEQVGAARAARGARALRLALVAERFEAATLARAETRLAIEETDVPTAIAELQKTLTVLQATQASFTKLSGLSLFDYLR